MKDTYWHRHYRLFPLIFRDQYGRKVFVMFEEVWRRWVPGEGWEYDLD